ncbi:hypothetical protein [Haloprofundus salinisoli]|uniref:hypothetical protein n=1 Tax=Haloprofundus salinisoli TaxID=2876193 RepID=UPI001CCE1A8C|nr:hypothetical protein [Haloprofundus salinisoli]
MVYFECEVCGTRVSNEVSVLYDRSRLCEDGWSMKNQKDYLPEGFYIVGSDDDIYLDVEGDYLLNGEDVIMMDRFEAAPIEEYVTFYGCCELTGEAPNTFCVNGHKYATEISDHCSRVVQLHRDRVVPQFRD